MGFTTKDPSDQKAAEAPVEISSLENLPTVSSEPMQEEPAPEPVNDGIAIIPDTTVEQSIELTAGELHIHLHFHGRPLTVPLDELTAKVQGMSANLQTALRGVIQGGPTVSTNDPNANPAAAEQAAMDRLAASINTQTTIQQGVITLLSDISNKLRNNAHDPSKIIALADVVDANNAALAAAIQANTPNA